MLRLLAAAEKEIEQALGGSCVWHDDQRANHSGSSKAAAQPALKRQLDTQRLSSTTQPTSLPCEARGKLAFTIKADGK